MSKDMVKMVDDEESGRRREWAMKRVGGEEPWSISFPRMSAPPCIRLEATQHADVSVAALSQMSWSHPSRPSRLR